jgi:UDP-N-acetylglucosamine--N-acetylmuramyl-(pentapeptide) pyrophosphoryl-undecaprenol N-acetylglucosamine transferase
MTSEESGTLIVTGGGTGGHIFAGVAIADEWKRTYPNARVLFVGASGGLEERLVPKAGYPLDVLNLGSLKSVSAGKRFRTLLQIPFALLKSAKILIREKPVAVVGVGGYASGPVVLIARLVGWCWGVKTAILEQNAVPGFTNRVLSRFSQTVFCAFPGIEKKFSSSNTVITGNPVRKSMVPFVSADREPFTVFIFGGSLGAVGINTLVIESLEHLVDLIPNLRFVHQTGERDYDRVASAYKNKGVSARVEKFIADMPECYRLASLVICRSGSSTLAELAAVRRASILIPFPFASDNHQEKNARLFVDAGAADLLIQAKATGLILAEKIRSYYHSPDSLKNLETGVSKFYTGNSTEMIVSHLSRATGNRK